MALCHIALGSNLGDRAANLQAACALLPPHRSSVVYETDPVDCPPGSQPFLNAVVAVEWDGSAQALHEITKGIEAQLGRPTERSRNASRVIDLDLLTFGQEVITTAELQIPHPRLHQRRFVLQPLADLSPDLILPGFTHTIAFLLANLDSPEPPLRKFSFSCLLP
jgi:2-amino-4-hydroxy-6-hydroxymethyldihydropteridine diphosphokinase